MHFSLLLRIHMIINSKAVHKKSLQSTKTEIRILQHCLGSSHKRTITLFRKDQTVRYTNNNSYNTSSVTNKHAFRSELATITTQTAKNSSHHIATSYISSHILQKILAYKYSFSRTFPEWNTQIDHSPNVDIFMDHLTQHFVSFIFFFLLFFLS